MEGGLRLGDLVWIGFHVNQYINKTTNAENVSMNISFVVVLKRCGRATLCKFLDEVPTSLRDDGALVHGGYTSD